VQTSRINHPLARAAEEVGLQLFGTERFDSLAKVALDRTGRWHQRECLLKAPFVLGYVLLMNIFRDKSLARLLLVLLGKLRETYRSLHLDDVTPEAMCKAKERLGPEPLEEAFRAQAAAIDPPPWFHGHRVWSLDGTKLSISDTPQNEAVYGRPGASRGRTGFPQALLVTLLDVRSHLVRGAYLGHCRIAERAATLALLGGLGERDLLLMDRGFPAVWFFLELEERKIPFVVRMPAGWKAKERAALGPGDWIVEVEGRPPSSPELRALRAWPKAMRLTLRMIEYRVDGGNPVRLLTNVMETRRITAREIAKLYRMRWESEISFDEIKSHLATVRHAGVKTAFRSKSPEGVRQEAFGLLVAYNLIRQVMADAADRHQIPVLEISFVEALELIGQTILLQRAHTKDLQPLLYERLLDDIATRRLSRPRRKEVWPRKVKVKMSNFGVKRPFHKAEPRAYVLELVANIDSQEAWPSAQKR
jgi:Transposase DDE domain/Insertion element 4 transposase N-terminal